MSIWGLTLQDCENASWNSVGGSTLLFCGMATAAAANVLSRLVIPSKKERKTGTIKHLACTAIGVGVGVLVSFDYANRVHCVQFVFEKAMQFFVLSFLTAAVGYIGGLRGALVVWLATQGGMWGYFGRNALYFAGVAGPLLSSCAATYVWIQTQQQDNNRKSPHFDLFSSRM
jgi:hypothetical protein